MSANYNVGVIGYGLSAKIFHIPFINDSKSFKLHSIVQRSPKPDDDAGKDFPNTRIYRSAEELVKDPDIHLVVLTTTPATHFDLASLAIKAGKHVLVEKPFVPTSREAQTLVDLASTHNVLLTTYQNRRYDSDFQTLLTLVSSNTLGRIADFNTHFDRHRPAMPATTSWKADPSAYSAIYDLGTHLMDQLLALYGMPSRITGFVGTQRGSANTVGLEDSFTVHLHYDARGMMATARAGVVSAETQQLRYWIRGEKGSWTKFHLDPQEDQLKAGKRPGDSGYGVEADDRFGTLTTVTEGGAFEQKKVPTVATNGYTAFYDQLAVALRSRNSDDLPVKPKEAVDLIKLVEYARASSKEGRTLVVE